MIETLPAPQLEHVCDLAVTIAAPVEVGQTPAGLRRMIPITGGVVQGPRLNGKVLAGGADFQLILGGGTQAHLDARYVIELEDGTRNALFSRLAQAIEEAGVEVRGVLPPDD